MVQGDDRAFRTDAIGTTDRDWQKLMNRVKTRVRELGRRQGIHAEIHANRVLRAFLRHELALEQRTCPDCEGRGWHCRICAWPTEACGSPVR